ncbi:unnamed protein product [Protopolystoma xenopodis]|uniref:Uncharacterized protein n=1 Tax=Protopolystoma xenopodis TaxID=117903 RepID=A0A448X1D7_9PLAT|nr:unnamed protein product [Protopolystoma xenopodis]
MSSIFLNALPLKGECSFVPPSPRVTMVGIPRTPAEVDEALHSRGPIFGFSNSYACIQDVVSFKANDSALGISRMLTGNVSGPCTSALYYLVGLPETNLYLLVMENWRDREAENSFYPFNCQITRRTVASGAYRIINGTCAHQDDSEGTLAEEKKCPPLLNVSLTCAYNAATAREYWVWNWVWHHTIENSSLFCLALLIALTMHAFIVNCRNID